MALSDLLRPRICELGKIKIGGKGEARQARDGGTYRLPVKYDHFIITTMNRDKDDGLLQDVELMASLKEFADADGKLRTLPVAVLSNEIEDVIECNWMWYVGQKMAGKSDGEEATLFYDPKSSQWLKEPVTVAWDPDWAEPDSKGNRIWKLHTTLNVVLATTQGRFGGVYKFRTTSRITADQLYGSLLQLKALTGGILRGMPLNLVVRPQKVSPQGKATVVYVVHVELRGPNLQAIQDMAVERAKYELANAQQLERARLEYRRIVRAPETDVELADIADEFHAEVPDEPEKPSGPDPLAKELGIAGDEPPPEPEKPAEAPPATPPEEPKQEQPQDPPPATPAKPPLSEARQKEILTELHRLNRAWHADSVRKWVGDTIGRELPAGTHLSELTEDDALLLLDKLVHMAPPKPQKKKAGAAT